MAIGTTSANTAANSVAIGSGTRSTGGNSIVIGSGQASGTRSIAIGTAGTNAISATGDDAISIGSGARSVQDSIAIGHNSTANNGTNNIAIGNGAVATNGNSIAIGHDARTQHANEIVLGTEDNIVVIPGRLVVDHCAILGRVQGTPYLRGYFGGNNSDGTQFLRVVRYDDRAIGNTNMKGGGPIVESGTDYSNFPLFGLNATINGNDRINSNGNPFVSSDRRLKNIGDKYTAGLAELKKLDAFHYTFKKDEAKKPHVGVIAQDLQEVFPDSVTKGSDGYLRIRWDEMFYAVINAVKELDARLTALVEQVKSNTDKVQKLEATISEQQKTIEDLKAQNEIYEKQFELLEKRIAKLEKRGK